jgi:hypothetical protein
MSSPFVILPRRRGYVINKFEFVLCQVAFTWIWALSSSVVLEKMYDDLTQFLHFCDYLPFEEDVNYSLICKLSTQGWFEQDLAGCGEILFQYKHL